MMEGKGKMERIKSDTRFQHVLQDPRFKRIPKRERKVTIDSRFKDMFKDEHFKTKFTMDKRGRPISHTTNEDLKNYYELSSSECTSDEDEEDEDEDEDEKEKEKTEKLHANKKSKSFFRDEKKLITTDDESSDVADTSPENKLKLKRPETSKRLEKASEINSNDTEVAKAKTEFIDHESGSSDNSEESENDQSESDSNSDIDLARGEGNVESSDEDDTSSETSEEENDEFSHPWGELDVEAPETNEITRRLAICNMNWDRIKAIDVFVLMNSFKGADAVIHSVKIYSSEYGKARLKEEDVAGPQELVEKKLGDNEEDDVEGSAYHMEKLRTYQLNRLRYYYAVVECDNANTANKIYEECNGLEYESSSVRLDLRFIPDSMTFDDEPSSVAESMPDPGKYNPSLFTTSALQQAKVDLTWDETDPERIKATRKAFSQKDIDNEDMRAYLASSDDDGDDDSGEVGEISSKKQDEKVENENVVNEEDRISKYRALLLSIEESEKEKSDKDVQLEITWTPGLKDTTQQMVDKKISEDKATTPWDQYLQKKREKKKEKREKRKPKGENEGEYSDDEIPSDVDLNDPFFKQDLGDDYVKKGKNTKGKGQKRKTRDESDEDSKKKKAELELMLMEPDDGKQHYNLKSLITDNKGKKKRKNKQDSDKAKQDTFQINVNDERFAELFTSHLYNIDPSDAQFKKTKGMTALIEEKQRRRETNRPDQTKSESRTKTVETEQPKKDQEITRLVRSIKSKAHVFGKKRNWK